MAELTPQEKARLAVLKAKDQKILTDAEKSELKTLQTKVNAK